MNRWYIVVTTLTAVLSCSRVTPHASLAPPSALAATASAATTNDAGKAPAHEIDTVANAPSDPVWTTAPRGDIAVPPNHRIDYNFNVGWKFAKKDVPGAESPKLDDSTWKDVSLPHTFNDADSYTHTGPAQVDGELGSFAGVTWYRKHFSPPVDQSDRKVFIEFEGVRQRATVYINGVRIGMSETGFVPFGFDLTPHIRFGKDNVVAVQCDNTFPMTASGSNDVLGWHNPHWHPNFGGIYRDVYLRVTDKLYVTLPIVNDLQTSGIYVHTDQVTNGAAPVAIEAQIKYE